MCSIVPYTNVMSPCVHVTWLKNPIQKEKYDKIIKLENN
jgi:predicted nucleic acid-binding Zn finger protein